MDKRLKKSEFTKDINDAWRKKLLASFSVLIELFNKYDLKWCCAFGTCLGAVREKGMIEWDNDIDIYMPRSDFERFKRICSEIEIEGYELLLWEDSPYLAAPAAHFTDTSSTFMFWRRLPFVTGIGSIDIDPIDEAPSDMECAKNAYQYYYSLFIKWRDASAFYSIENLWYYLTHGQKRRAFRNMLYSLARKFVKRRLIRQYYNLINHDYANTENVVGYCNVYPEKEIMPKIWFENLIEVNFEGMKVKIPKMYHEYLTHFYGDYMTPPPPEKRDDSHIIDYFNLDCRLSFNEILEEIRKQGR